MDPPQKDKLIKAKSQSIIIRGWMWEDVGQKYKMSDRKDKFKGPTVEQGDNSQAHSVHAWKSLRVDFKSTEKANSWVTHLLSYFSHATHLFQNIMLYTRNI